MSRWWVFVGVLVIWIVRVPIEGGSPLFGVGFVYGAGGALLAHWLCDKVNRL